MKSETVNARITHVEVVQCSGEFSGSVVRNGERRLGRRLALGNVRDGVHCLAHLLQDEVTVGTGGCVVWVANVRLKTRCKKKKPCTVDGKTDAFLDFCQLIL